MERVAPPTVSLPRYAFLAGLLAAAGLPIYIHAPKFYVDQYGISLASIGGALVILRLLDVVQDPLLGRMAYALRAHTRVAAAVALMGLAAGMIGLFAISAPVSPLVWMGVCLFLLFTSFSFLTILLYSAGIQFGAELGRNGHVRLGAWREAGALFGVSLASIGPFVFQGISTRPYADFAWVFAIAAVLAAVLMHRQWRFSVRVRSAGFIKLLDDPGVRRILAIAFFNAAPVAVTSTLFLFFVDYRLGLENLAGVYLLGFFLAAAVSTGFWARLAARLGETGTLAIGMVLSVAVFGWAFTLTDGESIQFALICLGSGMALGADMTILPAIFSARILATRTEGELGFGLWNFATKLTLALSAAIVLPLLERGGFAVGQQNGDAALSSLSFYYALVPCLLKILALSLLWLLPPSKVSP